MKSPAQARRLEEKQQRRNDIIDATEQVIAQKSWEETNFGDIASLTRLSRSLIYVYFPTKEALFDAVCDRGAVILSRMFGEAIELDQTGLDQVEALGWAYHRFAIEHPIYFKLHAEQQSRDELSAASDDHPKAAAAVHPAFGPISRALIKGMKDGSISPNVGDLKTTALALWTFTHGLLLITARKRSFLEGHMEVASDALVQHGFQLMRSMLSSSLDRDFSSAHPFAKPHAMMALESR